MPGIIAEIPARFEERISSRTGKPYKCVVLSISDKTEIQVFLKPAELELLELHLDI